MKKLMILGGTVNIVPVIEKAHELGIYVITCDFEPDNALSSAVFGKGG